MFGLKKAFNELSKAVSAILPGRMEADSIWNSFLPAPTEEDTKTYAGTNGYDGMVESTNQLPSEETLAHSQIEANLPSSCSPSLSLKVTHNKKAYDVIISADKTVRDLKEMLTILSGIPVDKQKIMWSRGPCPDYSTLDALGAKTGSKMMMVGSSNQEVTQIQTKPNEATLKAMDQVKAGDKLGEQNLHRKIIEKGIPSDCMPGILNDREPLPPHPLSGMVNKQGQQVRLTFKLEADQIWISTKERTTKVAIGNIRKVVNEPIVGHEEYHVVGLQTGTTEASIYWFYWVPCQYVDAIREVFASFN
ncbi:putative Ubiquitin domain-containing protein UBFD1 [Hypsibius exemplaris]|uniref:Ubiquitin domain-containing protein UBFD1 n=1 Tax=Hypsibius exemplaris TaxID=2072580 RepID=A0A9X6NCX2_HYPEX|nr:putative Ubiquitin domain-containing protein UBFD1 [Hypsibius exemplaris]